MADEVKIIHIFHVLIRLHHLQIDTALPKQISYGSFLLFARPPPNEVFQGRVLTQNIRLCVIDNILLTKQFPVCVIHGDCFAQDEHFTAVFIYNGFLMQHRRRINEDRRCFAAFFSPASAEAFDLFDRPIPFRIGKEPGHVPEVHHGEGQLSFFLPDPGSAANDLLELRHGADHLIQNDQLGHFAVRAGRQQLGRRGNDGIGRADGDEIVQLALAVYVASRDPNHIIRILLHHVRVQIVQCDPHPLGVFLCGAENNRFLHAVGAFQIAGNLRGYFLRAVFDDDVVIEIAVGVDPILNRIALLVQLTGKRPPAFIDVGVNIDHLEGCQEAILDAFLQAVNVDRFPEVIDVGNVFGFLRRCGHTDLDCGTEILQDLSPVAVLLGGTAVTLVHDDQVKEIRTEKRRQTADRIVLFPFIIPVRKLMVQREIDLMGSDGCRIILGEIDLMDRFLQRSEVLLDGLVHKDVSVRQIKHFPDQSAFDRAVYRLESGVCFAGTGCHDEQDPLLSPGNRVQRAVYSVPLIIAGRIRCGA